MGTNGRIERIIECGGRQSTLLTNGLVRILTNDLAGMTPEFSIRRDNGYLNTHWIPGFRGNSGDPYKGEFHAKYWKTELLYSIAGNFPCAPSFGPEHFDGDVWHPTHGWAADRMWNYESGGRDEKNKSVYTVHSMESPDENFKLSMKKIELLIDELLLMCTDKSCKESEIP